MIGPSHKLEPAADLELDDLTQEIDAPLEDRLEPANEPTLTKLDFDELEIDL
jgi:hypothetical protein